MATPTTQLNTQAPTDFMSSFKTAFPKYANTDNATLSSKITGALADPSTSKSFLATFRKGFPKTANLPDEGLTFNIKNSLQNMANEGQLSSGNQVKDMGLKTGLTTNNSDISKVLSYLTALPQALGANIGASRQAPANIQKYSDSLSSWYDEVNKLNTQIKTNKASGKDTSKLDVSLKQLNSSRPQISDFLDQTTLRRLNESTGQNVEEVIGQGIGTVLDTTLGGGLETGAETAVSGTKSLLGKIGTGIKVGSAYGATGAGAQSLANEQSAGTVAKNTAVGGIAGGITGGALEGTVGAVSNKIKTGSALNLGKVPEKLTGDEGALLNAPDAKGQIEEAQKLTKENLKNPDKPTASDVQGNKVHQDILTKAKTQLDTIGKKMESSLSGVVGEAKTDLGGIVKDFNSELGKRPEVSGYDTKLFNEFNSDLKNITNTEDTVGGYKKYVPKPGDLKMEGKVSPTVAGTQNNSSVSEVDKFLRKWQPVDFSNQMKNSSVGSLIDSTIHQINESAKTTADTAETKAGITGHPYRESNDEYSKLVSDYNDAKGELGTKRASTDKYDNSSKVFRANSTPNSSPAWKNLATATNTPLGHPSALTTFIEDIYKSPNPQDVLKNTRLSMNPFLAIARTAMGALGKSEQDPDAIVGKMLQMIDESGGKSTSVGGKIGSTAGEVKVPNAPEGHSLNIGMNEGNTKTPITEQQIKDALPKDVKILSSKIVKGTDEDTFVPQLSRPLTSSEMDKLLTATKQKSIPQLSNGIGKMFGSKEWGEFSPDYFLGKDGKPLTTKVKGKI